MASSQEMTRTRTPGVYRRGDRYAISWRDADRKQRWGSARTYDDARALKAAKDREARAGEQHVPIRQQPALEDYARELFGCDPGRPTGATAAAGRYQGRRGAIREATKDDYRRDLEAYWLPLLGSKRLPAIAAPDVARAVAELAARDGAEYLADRTLRRVFAPLSVLMATAVQEGAIRHNPCRDVTVPTGRDRLRRFAVDQEDDEQAVKPYTRAQIRSLLAALEVESQLHALIHLLATTGLRISEAIALQWGHVELDGGASHIKVRRAWVREQFGPPKSAHGRRQVPIGVGLVDELRRHRASQVWATNDDLVFPHSDVVRLRHDAGRRRGAVIRPENLRRRVLPFAQKADVPWTGFHGFRHAFASMLIEDGRNIVQVSRLLGHHSPSFTLSTYAHLMDDGVGGPVELVIADQRFPIRAR